MLEDLKPPAKQLPCRVRSVLDGLEDDDQDILMGALLDHDRWKTHVLSEELAKRGISASPNSIRKHRLRQCSCEVKRA